MAVKTTTKKDPAVTSRAQIEAEMAALKVPPYDKLTPEQQNKLAELSKYWIALSLSTDPIDREKTIEAYRRLYAAFGAEFPEKAIYYAPSSMLGAVAASFTRVLAENPEAYAIVRDRGKTWFREFLSTRISTDAGDELQARMCDAVVDLVFLANLPEEARKDVSGRDQRSDSRVVNDTFRKFSWHPWQGGALWTTWPAFISFARDVLHLAVPKVAEFYEDVIRYGSVVFTNSCFIVICDRPEVFKVDERGALHCEDGPAVRFRDGLEKYAIGGVILTKQIIMAPETLTLEQIKREQSTEVRRIMINRLGWDKYIMLVGAKVLDERINMLDGGVKETLMDAGEDGRVLLCSCPSTGRTYPLRVPTEISTCGDAQAWLLTQPSTVERIGTCLGSS